LRQFLEDDVTLVNGISCYKHGLFGVSEHFPHHDARVPVDDAGGFRAGPDEVDQVLGNRAVPAILTEHFEAVYQVPWFHPSGYSLLKFDGHKSGHAFRNVASQDERAEWRSDSAGAKGSGELAQVLGGKGAPRYNLTS